MSVSFEVIADALVAMSVSFDDMLVALFAMSVSFDDISEALLLLTVLLRLMLYSTSERLPSVKVPSISASFKIVTVPEV